MSLGTEGVVGCEGGFDLESVLGTKEGVLGSVASMGMGMECVS